MGWLGLGSRRGRFWVPPTRKNAGLPPATSGNHHRRPQVRLRYPRSWLAGPMRGAFRGGRDVTRQDFGGCGGVRPARSRPMRRGQDSAGHFGGPWVAGLQRADLRLGLAG